jgi:hypothetical protein
MNKSKKCDRLNTLLINRGVIGGECFKSAMGAFYCGSSARFFIGAEEFAFWPVILLVTFL